MDVLHLPRFGSKHLTSAKPLLVTSQVVRRNGEVELGAINMVPSRWARDLVIPARLQSSADKCGDRMTTGVSKSSHTLKDQPTGIAESASTGCFTLKVEAK